MSIETIQSAADVLARKYRDSIFYLAVFGLGYKDVNLRTHGGIIKALENNSRRKLLCVPRGCLKSSLACVAYVIWLLINNPNVRILIDSELYTNSATFLREIKAHLVSPQFVKLFGDFKSSCWNESEIIIKQRNKNLKEASVTVGGVGTTKVGQHFDYIIGDDMNSPANTANPEQAMKVINHYRMNTSILENLGTYVVIGTRYSELDLIGHIIRNEIDSIDFKGKA